MSVDLSILTVRQKAAILLAALPAEVSAPLCKELGPQGVQELTIEIARMPKVSPEVRLQVVDELLRIAQTALSADKMASAASPGIQAIDTLEKLARQNYSDLAKLIRKDWLKLPEPESPTQTPREGLADPQAAVDSQPGRSVDLSILAMRRKAAIFLMSLPPEVTAPLCKELGPQEVQELTVEIHRMPEVSPEVRLQVVDELLRMAQATLSADKMASAASQSTEASDVLEKLTRENPSDLAKLLKESWLNLSPQESPTQPPVAQTGTRRRNRRQQTCRNCTQVFLNADEFQEHARNCQHTPLAATDGQPPGSVDSSSLTGSQKAAIFLLALPPEALAPFCKELGPEEVQELNMEKPYLPEISRKVRLEILYEVVTLAQNALSEDKIASTLSPGSKIIDLLSKLAQENPSDLAKLLQDAWLNPPEFQKHLANCQTTSLATNNPQTQSPSRTGMRTGSRMNAGMRTGSRTRTAGSAVLLPPIQEITGPTGRLLSPNGHLPLKAMAIKATITGLLYQTTVTQTYRNEHDVHLEATYIFPLPSRAAVAGYTMTVGQEVVQGVLKERGQAQQDYQQALSEGRRSAMAEQERPDVFSVRVGNIAPQESIVIELQLEGPLALEGSEACFRFPLVFGPRYIPGQPLDGPQAGPGIQLDTTQVPDASRITPPILLEGHPNPVQLTIQVDVNPAGMPLNGLQSSLHQTVFSQTETGYRLDLAESERLDRDFILRLQLQPTNHLLIGPDLSFVLTVVPPPAPKNGAGRDIVILLDRSGSMRGWRMSAAIQAAMEIIQHLNPRDRFGLIAFDNSVEHGPVEALTPAYDENKLDVCKFLKTIDARGGTELYSALLAANHYLNSMGPERSLVLITDGDVGDHDALLSWSAQQAQTRFFAIGIGQAASYGLLQRLASQSGGLCRLVESEATLAKALVELHRAVGQPILQNLEILAPVKCLTPRRWDLFPEHPGMFFGQFSEQPGAAPLDTQRAQEPLRGPKTETDSSTSPNVAPAAPPLTSAIQLRAMLPDGGVWSESVTPNYLDSSLITKSWARSCILDLEDDWSSDNDNQKELVELSLKHQVLSRFTAFVAVHSQVQETSQTLQRVVQPVEMHRDRVAQSYNLEASSLGPDDNLGAAGPVRQQVFETSFEPLQQATKSPWEQSEPVAQLAKALLKLLDPDSSSKLGPILGEFGQKIMQELVPKTPPPIQKLTANLQALQLDPLGIEVGRGLLSLVDPNQGAKLLERVLPLRIHMANELGFLVPGVRFRDNLSLDPQGYRILVRGVEAARAKVHPDQVLAVGPATKLNSLTGALTEDPTFGMPAKWVFPEYRGDCERLGLMIFDPVSVVAVHLTELVRTHAANLLTFDFCESLLNQEQVKSLTSLLQARGFDRLDIWQVLRALLSEQVSIQDLDSILGAIVDHHRCVSEPLELVEFVRTALARQISNGAASAQKIIHAIVLDPKLERRLQRNPEFTTKMIVAIREGIGPHLAEAAEKSIEPVLLVPAPVRRSLRTLLMRKFPRLKVLSWNEIAPGYDVETIATLIIS